MNDYVAVEAIAFLPIRTSEKQLGMAKSFHQCTSSKQVVKIAFSGQQTDTCKLGTYCTKSDYGNDKSSLIFTFLTQKIHRLAR